MRAPSSRRGIRVAVRAAVVALVVTTAANAASAADPLTLDRALELARENNAHLPVAALDARMAEQDRAETASRRKIRLGVESDLSIAPRGGYDPAASNLGEDRLQVVLERPLYDGGLLAAEERRAGAEAGAAQARYRREEADVELAVRTRYAELLAARREATVRGGGLERLQSYLDLLESRGASGQPVESDLLRGRLRVATDAAARQAALEHADRARAQLNTLMGRSPDAPLEPAPLPAPAAADSGSTTERPVPDVAAAVHGVDAARAGLDAVRAERRPTLSLRADAGLWGTDTTRLIPPDLAAGDQGANFGTELRDRLDRDLGYSVSLGLTWSLFDSGGRQARTARARLALDQAQQRVAAEKADARGERTGARDARSRAYARFQILQQAAPQARDAYLDATSRYLGGAASSLDVVDAFDSWIELGVQKAQAELDYHLAEAQMIRWGGTP